MDTFYITTPIYYANSLPHLGHLYTTLVADCVRRHQRQRGRETYFLTGTDEHGINVQRAAIAGGRTPQAHVDHIVGQLQEMFAAFRLDATHGGYDIFMRTTEAFHYAGVAEFWRHVAAAQTPQGRPAIYKDFYEGWFCAACATFKTEDEYAKPAREGDPPLCLVHERPLDRVSEESYFFRLSDYADALLKLYDERPDFIRPEARRNEVVSFVSRGLQDLSVSRLTSSVNWAIPVPDDPAHTIYIWLDALTNYITALGWGNDERPRALFDKFWPGTHLIGKDILRQHAIYWPAFLLSAGVEQPRAVIAHGTWLDQFGRKMSKTIGNSVSLDTLRSHFPVDAVRYFCLREMAFGQDSKFAYESLLDRTNSDLASGLGNLSSRTLTMIARYCDGVMPAAEIADERRLAATRAGIDADQMELATALEHARDLFVQQFDDYQFSRALETAWSVIARADKMISEAKPWELAKDEGQQQTLNAVLYRAAESLRWLAVMLYPVMPESCAALWQQLGASSDPAQIDPTKLEWGGLRAGSRIGTVSALFPRLEKAKIMADIERENTAPETRATEADAVHGSASNAETTPEPPMRGATEADAVPGSGTQADGTTTGTGATTASAAMSSPTAASPAPEGAHTWAGRSQARRTCLADSRAGG